MNIDKFFEEKTKQLLDNPSNIELLDDIDKFVNETSTTIQRRVNRLWELNSKLKNRKKEFDKLYKTIKPRLCGDCKKYKNTNEFIHSGINYHTCNDCMIKRGKNKKRLKQQIIQQVTISELKQFTIKECLPLIQQLNKLLEYKYIQPNKLKTLFIDYSNQINFKEMIESINKDPNNSINDMTCNWLYSFQNKRDIEYYKWSDSVYNKLGNLLEYLIDKLDKCRKLTQKEIEERNEVEEYNSESE